MVKEAYMSINFPPPPSLLLLPSSSFPPPFPPLQNLDHREFSSPTPPPPLPYPATTHTAPSLEPAELTTNAPINETSTH